MTFKVGDHTYRLRRRWWGRWEIEKWDRIGAIMVHRGWWPLNDDEALDLAVGLADPRQDTLSEGGADG